VDGVRAEAFIAFGDVLVTLIADAVHHVDLLPVGMSVPTGVSGCGRRAVLDEEACKLTLPSQGYLGYNSAMIVAEVRQYIEGRVQGDVIYPCYESFSLAKIPSVILSLLGVPQPDHALLQMARAAAGNRPSQPKVVLLLIDGFGWQHWLRYAERYEALRRLTSRGTVAPITTVFPSTTAAALTAIHSGLTPQEHGLPEWWVYFDELETIAASLPFTALGDHGRDRLLEIGVKPTLLFQGRTIYQTLAKAQVPSFTFTRSAYAHSAYSSMVHRGSVTIPFINASDLLVNLRRKISEVPGPAYFYVYWDAADAIAHHYGPHTEHYEAELAGFTYLLQRELIDKTPTQIATDVLLMVTADHGHINVSPRDTLYLNRYPTLVQSLAVSPGGKRILPWGSPRDVFLRVEEEKLPAMASWLTARLDGKATVITTEEAFRRQLFGIGKQHRHFQRRVGNLLILPQRDCLIWYEHLKGKKFTLRGMHGGLRVDEMLIPLAVANLAALQ
jgi:Type I phosphodiesterase / nucleotide pyrophosphatase